MAKALTTEEFKQRLFETVGNKYSLKDGEIYKNKYSYLTFHCNIHNIDFQKSAECFMRGSNDIRGICPKCYEEHIESTKKRVEVECAYCGKKFEKKLSGLKNSKSGLYFCCREHKDLAQKLESGKKFNNMRPEHYGTYTNGATSVNGYRHAAFCVYPHKCAICEWNEDEDILQVHHIDENRNNGNIDNLIILCPTCHQKLTSQKYKLIGRDQIVLKDKKSKETINL